jgi:hypothetical protein
VYHYKEKSSSLFTDYINTFLKLKAESTGWPKDKNTEGERNSFVEEYEEKEGVKLESEKMVKNTAMRSLAKLCLNSFWGKFGQRENLPITEYFTKPEKFFITAFDESNILNDVTVINLRMLLMTYTKEEDFVENLGNVNPVLAAFVTAQARLKLYSYIEQLQDRVLYFDTDSILYLSSEGDNYDVPTGNFLGEMTDELANYGLGATITEFVSGGPKNYAYKVKITGLEGHKSDCKIKGLTLNIQTCLQLNFETLKDFVEAYVERNEKKKITIDQTRIGRTRNREVLTVPIAKEYQVVYDKRVIRSDYTTVPYGF